MRNNYIFYITESNSGALSTYSACAFLDHHTFIDPISGGNPFYPLTAYGGPLSANWALETQGLIWPYNDAFMQTIVGVVSSISGGPMLDVCYQEYCYSFSRLAPLRTFCISNVTFVLSGFEESTGKIVRITYDFDDGTPVKTINYNYLNNISPKNIIVSHDFYPKKDVVSSFMPTISVVKEDCCVSTFKLFISTFRCGIFDTFANSVLLDSTVSNTAENVVLTLEQQDERQLYRNLLKTTTPFTQIPSITSLPNLVEPIPVFNRDTTIPINTAAPTSRNPVVPPLAEYTYIEGIGVDLSPDAFALIPAADMVSEDTSMVIITGGAPYIGGTGITTRVVGF
jgi:hypothetical protein